METREPFAFQDHDAPARAPASSRPWIRKDRYRSTMTSKVDVQIDRCGRVARTGHDRLRMPRHPPVSGAIKRLAASEEVLLCSHARLT